MAISYPLTLPTATGFRDLTITADSAVAVTESPWTYKRQVQKNQGQRWMFEVTLPIMNRDDADEWESFFLKLNGQEGTFLMGDPARTSARGIATGTPVVKGGSQTGNSLVTDGWTTSQTGILKANDYIQLGTGSTARLYRNLSDVNSDSNGDATLDIWPAITAANTPNDNATIVVSSTVGVFRLTEDELPFNASTASLYNYSFKAVSEV